MPQNFLEVSLATSNYSLNCLKKLSSWTRVPIPIPTGEASENIVMRTIGFRRPFSVRSAAIPMTSARTLLWTSTIPVIIQRSAEVSCRPIASPSKIECAKTVFSICWSNTNLIEQRPLYKLRSLMCNFQSSSPYLNHGYFQVSMNMAHVTWNIEL